MESTDLGKRVCAQFLRLSPNPMVVKANRQSGKTQLVWMLAAKLVPTHRVCIVSSCRREAKFCLQEVANLLPGSEIAGDCVKFGSGWVHSGVKVVDADILLVDDVAYMDPTTFFDEVVPWLGNKSTLLIGTPSGNTHNILARMCRLKDKEGAHLLHVINATQRGSSL